MRRVATRRYVFAHREASRFHRISITHSTRPPDGCFRGRFFRPPEVQTNTQRLTALNFIHVFAVLLIPSRDVNLDFSQDPSIARPISKHSLLRNGSTALNSSGCRRHLPSTRRPTGSVVGADCEKADAVYLKRPPPAQAPCPRANPGLHLATRPASGRVALAPRRCAVTRALVVRESMS